MRLGGTTGPGGSLGLRVIRADGDARDLTALETRVNPWPTVPTLREIAWHGMPRKGLSAEVRQWRDDNSSNLGRGLRKVMLARALKIPHFYGQLYLSVLRADGQLVDFGLASLRMVTTVGVRFICDDFNAGATDVSNMKFHGIGTGALTEAATNTALVTEITTAYATDNVRPTGTQASATVSANATYTTVGTITVDAAVAATEHGIFSQAATGGGTLLDATSFSVVNLASGDSLQATYVLTMNSGG